MAENWNCRTLTGSLPHRLLPKSLKLLRIVQENVHFQPYLKLTSFWNHAPEKAELHDKL